MSLPSNNSTVNETDKAILSQENSVNVSESNLSVLLPLLQKLKSFKVDFMIKQIQIHFY